MGSTTELRAETERLFAIAGRKLLSAGAPLSPRLLHEKDDVSRWLWFLVEVGQHKKHIHGSSYTPERGQVDTHTHWLNGVLDDAIAGCLEAMKRELTK
jgi:hypothetical protein